MFLLDILSLKPQLRMINILTPIRLYCTCRMIPTFFLLLSVNCENSCLFQKCCFFLIIKSKLTSMWMEIMSKIILRECSKYSGCSLKYSISRHFSLSISRISLYSSCSPPSVLVPGAVMLCDSPDLCDFRLTIEYWYTSVSHWGGIWCPFEKHCCHRIMMIFVLIFLLWTLGQIVLFYCA